jgi:catechol 2,3-dioxygenase-like lactoylglutathione lyase family enzyme
MKLTHTPIVVRNQDEALKFYRDVLGFETRADYQQKGHPRWVTVAPTGDDVELILFEGVYSVDPRPSSDADSGGNHHVFATDDCRRDFEALKARGVRDVLARPEPQSRCRARVEALAGSQPSR